MPDATIYAVTIGAGLPQGGEMNPPRFREFQHAVRRAVARTGEVLAVTQGVGRYEGQAENCAVILGQADPAALPDLRRRLRRIAQRYGQDSIGLIAADPAAPALIYANERTPSHAP